MTVVAVALLAIWFAASLGNHLPGPWTPLLRGLNSCSLLPRVDFFAPDPINVDYHVAYRDSLVGGQMTGWQSLPLDHSGHGRFIWNPAKRDHQSLLAAVAALALIQQSVAPVARDPDTLLQLSLPYLFLLHYAGQGERLPGSQGRQFMIVESTGFGATRTLALGILSNFHRLP